MDGLAAAAAQVLHANDRGDHTVAAPHLYPHQWSWDAAFVAIGWAEISVPRALAELRHLLRGQWSDGMIPQIVFSEADGYFPDARRWRTAQVPAAPDDVSTSGICQPPVHCLAVYLIGARARAAGGQDWAVFTEFLTETYADWYRWHRWLQDARGTHPSGLIEIHHGWESGMDNSPRWDEAYARVQVGPMPPFVREDVNHVASASERPDDRDYERYLWLVEQLVSVDYDPRAAREIIDFRVGDVMVTALHALGSDLLADLAADLPSTAATTKMVADLRDMATRARTAVWASRGQDGTARDIDMRQDTWLVAQTLGGFAPLLCGPGDDPALAAAAEELTDLLLGPSWCAHPALACPVPPTTSPDSPAFAAPTYWRGPQWPVITWLLSWTLGRFGHEAAAAMLRENGLRQLEEGSFAEYYHPLTSAPLGSKSQSWTAAAALAWTAQEVTHER